MRCLLGGMVRSVALYGASVWYTALMASKDNKVVLRRLERVLAIKAI